MQSSLSCVSKPAIRIQRQNSHRKKNKSVRDAIVLSHWHIKSEEACIFTTDFFSLIVKFMVWMMIQFAFDIKEEAKQDEAVKEKKISIPDKKLWVLWHKTACDDNIRRVFLFVCRIFMGIDHAVSVTVTSDCIEWLSFYLVSRHEPVAPNRFQIVQFLSWTIRNYSQRRKWF